ncbi:hypothetical protein JHK84_035403 [Glycine max]|nr:hypothetical protein JHK84_035403 [Glycine max]
MAKPSSPANLASAIICFFASKKFPHRLKASPEGLQGKTLHHTLPSWSMFMNFSKYALPLVVCHEFGGHIGYIIGGLSAKNHAKIHFLASAGNARGRCLVINGCYLVDPASSHMLVSKIKPCMCKYELIQTVLLADSRFTRPDMGFHPTKLNFVPSDADEAPLDVFICLHAFGIVGCGSFSGVKSCEREGCMSGNRDVFVARLHASHATCDMHPFHCHLSLRGLGADDWFLCCLPTKRYSCG